MPGIGEHSEVTDGSMRINTMYIVKNISYCLHLTRLQATVRYSSFLVLMMCMCVLAYSYSAEMCNVFSVRSLTIVKVATDPQHKLEFNFWTIVLIVFYI